MLHIKKTEGYLEYETASYLRTSHFTIRKVLSPHHTAGQGLVAPDPMDITITLDEIQERPLERPVTALAWEGKPSNSASRRVVSLKCA